MPASPMMTSGGGIIVGSGPTASSSAVPNTNKQLRVSSGRKGKPGSSNPNLLHEISSILEGLRIKSQQVIEPKQTVETEEEFESMCVQLHQKGLEIPETYYHSDSPFDILKWELNSYLKDSSATKDSVHSEGYSEYSSLNNTTQDLLQQKHLVWSGGANLEDIERKIEKYSQARQLLNIRLSERVLENHNEFVHGMGLVHQIASELTTLQMSIQDSRRRLSESRDLLGSDAMEMIKKERIRKKILEVQQILESFKVIANLRTNLEKAIVNENYFDALQYLQRLNQLLAEHVLIEGDEEDPSERVGTELDQTKGASWRGANSKDGPVDGKPDDKKPKRKKNPLLTDFQCMQELRAKLVVHAELIQRRISDGLQSVIFSSATGKRRLEAGGSNDRSMNVEKYERILEAAGFLQKMMRKGQVSAPESSKNMMVDNKASVGNTLIQFFYDSIYSITHQSLLSACNDEFMVEQTEGMGTRKTGGSLLEADQLRTILMHVRADKFVDCLVLIYDYLMDLLYRYHLLSDRHKQRIESSAKAEEENAKLGPYWGETKAGSISKSTTLSKTSTVSMSTDDDDCQRDVLHIVHDVYQDLVRCRKKLWDKIQSQISLILITWNFECLSENSLFHTIYLTQLFIEEGDAFMNSYRAPQAGAQRHTLPLRNTLKTKCMDYAQAFHGKAYAMVKSIVEKNAWQRLPVARKFRLMNWKSVRKFSNLKQRGLQALKKAYFGSDDSTEWRFVNLFSYYDPSEVFLENPIAEEDCEEDEELLKYWLNYDENQVSHEKKLSDQGPVVTEAAVQVAHLLSRYLTLMQAFDPQLVEDLFVSLTQLYDYYVYAVLCLFTNKHDLKCFLGTVNMAEKPFESYRTFLFQKLGLGLKKQMLKTQDLIIYNRNFGAEFDLLDFLPYQLNKTHSPGPLCSVAERCVAVESCNSLLSALKSLEIEITKILNPGISTDSYSGGGHFRDFFDGQKERLFELQKVVHYCVARDILYLNEDNSRVTLDTFCHYISHSANPATGDGNMKTSVRNSSETLRIYFDQMKSQFEDFSRVLPCLAGGSIPVQSQIQIWHWFEYHLIVACTDAIARSKDMSLLDRFQELQYVIVACIPEMDEGVIPDVTGLSKENGFDRWDFIRQFVNAWSIDSSDVLAWCRKRPQYPLELHVSLICHHFPTSPKPVVQELQNYMCTLAQSELEA